MKPFLEYILQIIGSHHSVDYKNPDYTIFVEIQNVPSYYFSLMILAIDVFEHFEKIHWV
jgi:hypothetical protein